MKRWGLLLFAGVLGAGLGSLPGNAATPSFTVTATNATMPSSGDGSVPFTLSSVDGYAGSVAVNCSAVNAPVGARIPYCGGGPVAAFNLTANETVDGSVPLIPYGDAVPLAAGALLLGVFLPGRQRKRRWPMLALVVVGILVGLGGVAGCGGGSPGMTPGTYAYSITATDLKTSVVVGTTVSVTVR